MKNQDIISWLMGICLMALSFIIMAQNEDLKDKIEQVEARIQLHDGQAQLLPGSACIIGSASLEDEELAVNLVRACVREHSRRGQE